MKFQIIKTLSENDGGLIPVYIFVIKLVVFVILHTNKQTHAKNNVIISNMTLANYRLRHARSICRTIKFYLVKLFCTFFSVYGNQIVLYDYLGRMYYINRCFPIEFSSFLIFIFIWFCFNLTATLDNFTRIIYKIENFKSVSVVYP